MRSKIWTRLLFLIYLLVLTWVILAKMDLASMVYQARLGGSASVNMVPFAGTAYSNGQLDLTEVFLNLLVFIPYGVYLGLLLKNRLFYQLVLITGLSMVYELVQFLFSIGVADVTDILANSLGGWFGLLLYYLLEKILGEKAYRLINLLSLLGTVMTLLVLYFWV